MQQTLDNLQITNRNGRYRCIGFDLPHVVLLALLAITILSAIMIYGGVRLGAYIQTSNRFAEIARLQTQSNHAQTEIVRAQVSARTGLDALTLRLGQLQARVLRLDVLGARLVTQASLDAGEFDFNGPPPVGGPHTTSLAATTVPDFLDQLHELNTTLQDRTYKLGILERLLMNRNLHARVIPSGRAVEHGILTSRFGKRIDPFTGKQGYHGGVDIAAREGSNIMAVGDGVVIWSGHRKGYGNLVEIDHGNGFVTRYGHNRAQLVTLGETVKKGQSIALLGSTGRSTGPHVHIEVLRHGKQVNPSRYLKNE